MESELGIILIAQTRPTWVILKQVKNEISSIDIEYWHTDKRDL